MMVRVLVAVAAFAVTTYVAVDLITVDPPVTTVETISLEPDEDRGDEPAGNPSEPEELRNDDGDDERDEPQDADDDDERDEPGTNTATSTRIDDDGTR